ncbi:hypothetical protein AnigIFM63604_010967 [Aspergillus niger]|uniref:Uncharacterized protein n=1 Tax=Aspergillus niger TaxID=5061 RepID=A0A9W6EES6_ASPNG|nr:hypothetical protein AnigIFM63604_010967 [Aspergillus niger]
MSSRVTVVVYETRIDEPCHWAMWIRNENKDSVILQAGLNKGGYYVEEPIRTDPLRSKRIKNAVYCGTIPSAEHNQALLIIQNYPVDNETVTWNCQAWVMEALERLEQMRILQVAPGSKATLESIRQRWK